MTFQGKFRAPLTLQAIDLAPTKKPHYSLSSGHVFPRLLTLKKEKKSCPIKAFIFFRHLQSIENQKEGEKRIDVVMPPRKKEKSSWKQKSLYPSNTKATVSNEAVGNGQ